MCITSSASLNLAVISFQDKNDLIDAARRLNPAFLHAAPDAFWNVEGTTKTVSSSSLT